MRAEKWSCSSIIIRVVNFDGAFSGAKSRGWVALAFHPPVVVISRSRHQCVKCGVHPSRSPVGVISQQVWAQTFPLSSHSCHTSLLASLVAPCWVSCPCRGTGVCGVCSVAWAAPTWAGAWGLLGSQHTLTLSALSSCPS